MKIQYFRRDVYGNPLFYIVGEQAEALRRLTGKKTVDKSDLAALEALGHTTELVHEKEGGR
jgi:hypothetical protein